MLTMLYIAAAAVMAFCLWLLCWWSTAEPAMNAWRYRRAEARRYRRAHRFTSDASYWLIPACGVIAIWAL